MVEARRVSGTEAEVQRECKFLIPTAQPDAQVGSKADGTDFNDSQGAGGQAFFNAQGGLCALAE